MAQVKLSHEGLKVVLASPAGPVAKHVMLLGQRVVNQSKRYCPVDTSRLRNSIRQASYASSQGFYVMVGTDVKYALYVHEGTKPHFPPPSAMQPWARRHGFPPGRGGGFLVARAISQRGTKAQPFLTDAIEQVGLRWSRG